MKKKNLLMTFLLAALVFGGGQSVWAHDFTATNQGKTIYYTITDAVNHKVAVAPNGTSTNSYEGDIVIPETVINPNDNIEYTVTSIAASAFKRSYEGATGGRVTSVELPETITSIGDYAFRNCSTYLADINIPTAVESIGTYAFDACKGITSITLSSNLTSLGQQAFNACTAITVINYNAESLSDFVNNKGPFYGCTTAITLNIGNNVTTIPAYAFQGANITGTVTIPDNVETIKASAFYGLTSISKLIIGSGVTTFGNSVFSGCTGLTEIIAKPTTVPASGYSLFYNVTKSIPVYIPSGSKESYTANLQWNGFTNYKEFFEFTDHYDIENGATLESEHSFLLTGAGAITIKNGGIVTSPNILGSTTENLIIEDGGKLIVYGSGIQATIEKEVKQAANWGTGTTYDADGWYFIASPVNGAAFPTGSVATQDIYQLDWANSQWLNLQNDAHNSLLDAGFQRGTGYLYASKGGNTISVAGEIQPLSGSDDATVTLATTGWNLIGNPLTCKVTVDKAFSELNNASSVTNQDAGAAINPFQGIAVYGTAGDVVTFTKATSQNAVAPSNNALQMTLSQTVASRGTISSEVVDNAIVKFNGNSSLPKFSMLEGKAKLYIPQNGEDYAIVSTNAEGEMPVNFKANENGQYTLTVNAENVEMNYLHLIDNMTGADIDLMANPSYTFNANATDYASRFRIVFSGNGVEENLNESDNFAFIGSDGQLIVSGTGTIQILDMMGRVISTKSTEENISTNGMASGVYVLRLIGNETKTQKIVVR